MSTIKVDTITDEAGTGAPDFPNGMTGSAASLTAIPAAQLTGTLPAIDGSALTGVDAFKPVAVTGATPSLDVGSFNFFDNGTLSADTTVSFASVPTEARWSYSFENGGGGGYDISTASYLQSFSVSAQGTQFLGLFLKPDGTKMYLLDYPSTTVYEYNLSTAFDVSTASYASKSFSVGAQGGLPYDLFFKPDGLKMYIVGVSTDSVHEYDLSTAWDVSTAVFLQSLSVATQDTTPVGLFFKPDGTKMYVVGAIGKDVNEYDLSTAWDISTASFLQLFSVSAQDTGPRSVFFKPDGLKMYILGATGDNVYEYNLSTAWDVSTASYLQSVSVVTNTPDGYVVTLSPDGSKMYLLSYPSTVVQYTTSGPAAVTIPASVQNPPTAALSTGDYVTYEFYTLDGGTTVTLINEEVL